MESNVSQKFCKNCGKQNEMAAKFCKACGTSFPEIDHPAYLGNTQPNRESAPVQPTKPTYPIQNNPYQNQSTSQNQPSIQNQPPPHNQQRLQPNQMPPPQHSPAQSANYGMPVINPPRMWRGGNIFDSIFKLYTDPRKYSGEILEDPKAPRALFLILAYAAVNGLLIALQFLRVDYVSVDAPPEVASNFTTADGRRGYAIMTGSITAVMIFVVWVLMSWILSSLTRGGIHYAHYARHNSTAVMRRLTAYLTIPFTLKNLVLIFILQSEDRREAEITTVDNLPRINFLTDYSSLYYNYALILGIISGILAAIVFYRSMRDGLNTNSSFVGVIAFFIVFFSYMFS